jgi:hypothetical protein
MHKNENTQNSHQHKILRFFDTHIDIKKKKILGHNSTFCNLKM